MICSAKELGLGDDHDGIIVLPADAGQPGDDAFDVLPLRDEVIEFEINPDRAYALSLRGVGREAALAYDVAVHRPRRPARSRRRTRRRTPSSSRTPSAARSSPGRSVTRLRPVGADAGLDGPAHPARGHAADLAGRRRHQLRDARARPADPRLRPRQARRPDRRTPGASGREGSPRSTASTASSPTEDLLITDDSGPIGLAGVMGGETTELSGPRPTSSSRPPTGTRSPSSAPSAATSCRPRPPSGSSAAPTRPSRWSRPTASPSC